MVSSFSFFASILALALVLSSDIYTPSDKNAAFWGHSQERNAAKRRAYRAIPYSSGEFGRIRAPQARRPGFTLVSFLPPAKKDTASIPCAICPGKK
jgi:hypothetical protein